MISICKCDVNDKISLAIYRNIKKRLQNCLSSKDIHSISNQVQDLVWNDSIYRSFNEARRISEITADPTTGFSGTLYELIDQSFLVLQSTAIRRLTDRSSWETDKAVYSLPTILFEIENNRKIFTRENFLCYDGMPYDEDKQNIQTSYIHDYRNITFDKLALTDPLKRKRTDTISSITIKHLKKQLKEVGLIRGYVNKFIAHAASPDNRRKIEANLKLISLEKFDKAYKSIIYVGKIISTIIDSPFLSEVAIPQFDQFTNWDKPFITKDDRQKLFNYWDERTNLIKSWSNEELSL